MSDIYSTPNASLVQASGDNNYGSIEKALAGDYTLDIGAILSEAWAKTNGCKWTFQIALSIYLVIVLLALGVSALINTLIGFDASEASIISSIGMQLPSQVLYMALTTPAFTGLSLLGLRRAAEAPIRAGQILNYYSKIVPLVLTAVITTLLMVVGYLALILPGIYLSVAFLFAPLLVAEKGMNPLEAINTSRKAVSKKWFAMFGLGITIALINVLGAIPLGIGLIWTVPMSMIAMGIAYRDMFGCEAATLSGA